MSNDDERTDNDNGADGHDSPASGRSSNDDALAEHGFQQAFEQVSAAAQTREGRWKFWSVLAGLALLAGFLFQQAPQPADKPGALMINIRLWGTGDPDAAAWRTMEEAEPMAESIWPISGNVEIHDADTGEVLWSGEAAESKELEVDGPPDLLRVVVTSDKYESFEGELPITPEMMTDGVELDAVLLMAP